MDIWIIQNGEKIGPIHDFDVRKMIENGELPAATPAWHEGLTAWKPLVEISLFERELTGPSKFVTRPTRLPIHCRTVPRRHRRRTGLFLAPAVLGALVRSLSVCRLLVVCHVGHRPRHRGHPGQPVGHSLAIRPVVRAGNLPPAPLWHHSREMAARPQGRQQRRFAPQPAGRPPGVRHACCASASASAGGCSR